METQVYCYNCGSLVNDGSFCSKCGTFAGSHHVKNRYSKGVAIILALFFGGLGFHKFYLGHWIQGLLYLLFFITFIPTILSLIDMFIYIFMSDEEFQLRYGYGA